MRIDDSYWKMMHLLDAQTEISTEFDWLWIARFLDLLILIKFTYWFFLIAGISPSTLAWLVLFPPCWGPCLHLPACKSQHLVKSLGEQIRKYTKLKYLDLLDATNLLNLMRLLRVFHLIPKTYVACIEVFPLNVVHFFSFLIHAMLLTSQSAYYRRLAFYFRNSMHSYDDGVIQFWSTEVCSHVVSLDLFHPPLGNLQTLLICECQILKLCCKRLWSWKFNEICGQ